ncbi:MAG: hypothetical protein Q8N23_34525 [Archangium sp.]|nr:hypothetical protein [Archangium sp.]MDP3157838.1 hypothetical protein [Archangium sp.]MDP3571920.1 hypothetical protein [Archangium sp.]
MSSLIKAPPQALTKLSPAEDARAQIAIARERLVDKLDVVQRALSPVLHWRAVVKRHPVATIGGAFLFGYAVSKFFSRK